MHLGGLLSTQEARVALSYHFLILLVVCQWSVLPDCFPTHQPQIVLNDGGRKVYYSHRLTGADHLFDCQFFFTINVSLCHQFACDRLTLKGPVGELSIIVHYKRKSSTIAGWKRSLPRAIGATGQRTISSHDITNNTSHNASSLVGLWSRYTIDGFYCAKCQ